MGLAILLLIGLGVAFLASVWLVLAVLLKPPRRTYAAAVARGRAGEPGELIPARAFQSWKLRSRGLELPVWDIEGDDPEGPVVVLTHGWADSRIGALVRVPALAPTASRLIAWDLPGHGEAPGRTRMGTREGDDLLALLEQLGSARDVVLYGWSLGAGVSFVAAAKIAAMTQDARTRLPRIAAIVAEAPYRLAGTPARNVLRVRRLPYRLSQPVAFWLAGIELGVGPRWRGFDRAAWAGRIACPLLVLHGERDEICPLQDGREIAEAAHGELAIIAGGRHNDLWTDTVLAERCAGAVRVFLARVRAARPKEIQPHHPDSPIQGQSAVR